MFGQRQTSTPFGSQGGNQGSPFGAAPTPAFGTSSTTAQGGMFGSTSTAGASMNTNTTNTLFGGGGGGGFGSPAPASSGFGGISGGFGSNTSPPAPAFGAASTTTPFGAPTPSTGGGLFGNAPAPATGGGLFGSTPAPSTGLFGNASTPAAPSTGMGAFGSTTPNTTGGFGVSSPLQAFGAPTPATGGGLFGNSTAAPTPAFGAPAAPAFGSPPATNTNTGGLFGATSSAPTQGGGLFGSSTINTATTPGTSSVPYATTSIPEGNSGQQLQLHSITAMEAYKNRSFEELRYEDYVAGNRGTMGSAPATTSAFGSTAPAKPAFGSATPAPSAFGAPATSSATTGGLFGSTTAPSISTFGSSPATTTPAFGSPAPAANTGGFGVFGSTATTTTPATGGGLFGAQTPAPAVGGGFGFGATAAKPPAISGGLFGAAPAPSTTGGLFGSSPAPATTGGLFGNTATAAAPATGSIFGTNPAPAPATGSLFGGTPAAATSTFGAPAPATGGLFGASTTPLTASTFGAPAPSTGGLFGNTTASTPAPGGLFGAPAATAPANTGGLFGATTTAAPSTAGGLFGATPAPTATPGGLFGSPPSTFTAPATGGLFGQTAPAPPAPATGGLFGQPAPSTITSTGVTPAPFLAPPSTDAVLAQQLAAVDKQRKELELLNAWRTSPNSINNAPPKTIPSSLAELNSSNTTSALSMYKGRSSYSSQSMVSSYRASQSLIPRSLLKVRPRGFPKVSRSSIDTANAIAKIGSNGHGTRMSLNSYLGTSVKHLVIRPGALSPSPRKLLHTKSDEKTEPLTNHDKNSDANVGISKTTTSPSEKCKTPSIDKTSSPIAGTDQRNNEDSTKDTSGTPSNFVSPGNTTSPKLVPNAGVITPSTSASNKHKHSQSLFSTDSKAAPSETNESKSYNYYKEVVGDLSSQEKSSDTSTSHAGSAKSMPNARNTASKKNDPNIMDLIPKLTKEDYTMVPSADEMSKMSEADLAAVTGFKVERLGLHSIAWDGAVDVRNFDVDTSVTIHKNEVCVYDEEEKNGTKPPVGSKLNRSAIITMRNQFPKGKSEEQKKKHESKIRKGTKSMNAEFISYDVESGIWKFRVFHFSRYGLLQDDDSDDEMVIESSTKLKAPSSDDEMSEDSIGNNLTLTNGDNVLDAANTAYSKLCMDNSLHESNLGANRPQTELGKNPMMQDHEDVLYDEGEEYSAYSVSKVKINVPGKSVGVGICSRIAHKCGLKSPTSSGTDFGMRMGRSFRVGWNIDGTFAHPINDAQTKVLKQNRPSLLSLGNTGSKTSSLLLQTHLENSDSKICAEECPIFSLPTLDSITSVESESTINSILENYKTTSFCPDTEKSSTEFMMYQVSCLIMIYFIGSLKQSSPPEGKNLYIMNALKKWLQEICVSDVGREIMVAKGNNDIYSAIFAAISGFNITDAISIALENGMVRLASILANSGMDSKSSLSEQNDLWEKYSFSSHTPSKLLRIYTLLAGDLSLEGTIYKNSMSMNESTLDWYRHLGMLLWYKSDTANKEKTLCNCMLQYESDIARGFAPHPYPALGSTQSNFNGRPYSILFLLLKVLIGNKEGVSRDLTKIILQYCHSTSFDDVSQAFHFAATLSMLKIIKPFSFLEECDLIENYSMHLINSGKWEWAVYVTLCTFGEHISFDSSLFNLKRIKAKEIIMQNFEENDRSSCDCRNFLEKIVGIPSAWFEKAIATKCIYYADPLGYVKQTMNYSSADALRVYNDLIIPSALFAGGVKNCNDISFMLNEMKNTTENFETFKECVMIKDFLSLSDYILECSRKSSPEQVDHTMVHKKLNSAINLYTRIKNEWNSSSTSQFPGIAKIPKSVHINEVFSSVSLILMQLKALDDGMPLIEHQSEHSCTGLKRLKLISQLDFLSSAHNDISKNFPDVRRDLNSRYSFCASFGTKIS